MSLTEISGAALGVGAFGQLALGQPARWSAFAPEEDDDLLKIVASTPSGSVLGVFYMDIQNTAVRNFSFKTGDKGGTEFKMVLNQDPGFPLVKFTNITVFQGSRRIFRGYIWKKPGAGKNQNDPWEYSGFGKGKRLEKNKISLVLNENVYQIDAITMNGNDMTVQSIANLASTDVVGCTAIVKGSENESSDGRFTITAAATDSVTMVNPAGVAQTLDLGTLYILPREWSETTTMISDLIKQVVTNYFSDLPISQSTALIEDTPDALTNAVVDLEGLDFAEFFEQMRTLLNETHLLYIDEYDRVVLREKSGTVDTLLVGYDAHEVNETENENAIINRVTVNRKVGKETQKVGLITAAGFAEDADSIANDGVFADEQDVPVFWGDSLCQSFADAFVAKNKDPKITFRVENMPFRYYPLGDYRWISVPRRTETVLSECQDTTEWTWDDELITLVEDTGVKQFGAGSIRFDYDSSAAGKQVVFNTDFRLNEAEKLRFWFKGSLYGQTLTVGIGESSIEEHTFSLFVNGGTWKPYDIDLSSLGLSRIKKLGFIIPDDPDPRGSAALGLGPAGLPLGWSDPLPSEQFSLWVDQISVLSVTSIDRTFELVELEYEATEKRVCHLTFGSRAEGLDKMLAAQIRSLKTARLALRE